MRRLLMVLLTLTALVGLGHPVAGAETPAGDHDRHAGHGLVAAAQTATAIRIVDFGFDPQTVTIAAGTTVTWTNTGNATHTATSTSGNVFDSKTLRNGQTFSFKFDQAGTFAYRCEIHPSMTGTITVQGGAPPAATATPARTATATAPPATVAATQAAAPPAGQNAVKIVDFAFEPGTITVPVGATVTWTNTGNAPHTATADNKSFDSGRLANGGAFPFRFTTAGSFAYKCEVHPARMSGTVIVQAAAQAGGETRGATGAVLFGDSQARSDQARIDVQGLTAEAGTTPTAWLLNAAGDAARMGELRPDAAGKATVTYTDLQRRNLIALFDRAVVTAETARDGAKPAGKELMRDEIPAPALTHIRHLLARFEETPANAPLSTGLLSQAGFAADHANLARLAVQSNDLAGVRLHMEHIVNVIEGDKGPNFGDLNGDEKRDNPGDGFGLLTYATFAGQHAQFAIDAAPRDETIGIHGGHVVISTKNVTGWATEARNLGLTAVKAPNIAATRQPVERMVELLTGALEGQDANSDGKIDPIAGEGGSRTAYNHSQLMATLEPTAAQVSAAPAVPTAAVAPAAPAATVEAQPAAPAATGGSDGTRLVLIAVVAAAVLVGLVSLGAWFMTSRNRGGAGPA